MGRVATRQLTAAVLGLAAIAIAIVLIAGGGERTSSGPARAVAAETPPSPEAAVAGLSARIGAHLVRSSGVVIDPARGLVLTTAHSLWGAKSLRVSTSVAVVYGRIVARDTCGDVALVETQPRLSGLSTFRRSRNPPLQLSEAVEALLRRGSTAAPGALEPVPSNLVAAPAPARSVLPKAPGTLALKGSHPPEVSGAPVLDADGSIVGLARVVAGQGRRAAAVAMPWAAIAASLRELKPGARTIYVGWRDRNRCAGRLHQLAARLHPGFRRRDARLNVPVAATRIPGTQELDQR